MGRVVRCSIYYPALLAARMTERCATKLSVSTPVPLSDLLTKMRRRSAEDWNLGNLEVWKWFTSAIQTLTFSRISANCEDVFGQAVSIGEV